MAHRDYSIEELEELAIDDDLEAIKELVRRYHEGDGVGQDPAIAEHWRRQLGESEGTTNTEHNGESGQEVGTGASWDEQYKAMKSKIVGHLRNEAVHGSPAAMIVLAEKYLGSISQSEVDEGFRMLEEAERVLRADLSGEDAAFSREALIYLFNLRGEKLEQFYQETGDETFAEEIFNAYSNANELDPAQIEGIAHCYREGIGVEKDLYKARTYEERNALQGGIEEKYTIGRNAYDSLETIRATEWLQSALAAEDANDHIGLKHCIRLLLGRLKAADEEGNAIDEGWELNTLLQLAETQNDPEAALCMASLADRDDEKLRYYELGAVGAPDQYASVCAQKARKLKRAIAEKERERQAMEAKRAQEEKEREEEQRRLAEQAKRKAEQEALEWEQRQAEQAEEARKNAVDDAFRCVKQHCKDHKVILIVVLLLLFPASVLIEIVWLGIIFFINYLNH